MSNDAQPDEVSSPGELPETQWRGDAREGPDPRGPIHDSPAIHRPIREDAQIPGGPGAQPVPGDRSPAAGGTKSITELSEFRRSLVEIGLIGEEVLDALAGQVPVTEGVLGLARRLQEAGKLTAYQAAAVYQGKSRGLLIGNYLILDKLGAGGMGMVFKARHRRLGRVVALKILPPSFARDRTAVLRFKREVEAAGKLEHPNIVAALDADEDRGVHFLVMEYVEGRDLDQVVRQRGPLPVREAIDFLIQAARGLEAAHSQGIIHRDIKPSNLMLDSDGTVRVLDLGIARIVDATNPFGQAAGRLTESGMYMGTIDYMAPEQAEDSRWVDHRADIYSLGCTLHFLMTGREPFVADTVLKRLIAHQERPAPPLRATRPDAPSVLEDAFQRMMAKRPSDRPDSMAAVIALLESCRAEAAAASATTPRATPRSRSELKVFDEATVKRTAPGRPGRASLISGRQDAAAGKPMGSEFSLEDLGIDVRSEIATPPLPAPTSQRSVESSKPARWASQPVVLFAVGTMVGLVAAFIGLAMWHRAPETSPSKPSDARPVVKSVGSDSNIAPKENVERPSAPAPPDVVRSIFDGRTGKGWMLTDRKPLPPISIQPDGLNPHQTNSYLIVYDKKLGDFVLDCDYKLSPGSNSGVFVRVGDLKDPVHTGIEVAIDDTTGAGLGDSGALYGLVAPSMNAQRPAGHWNHLTITAAGPMLAVSLNGEDVSRINLAEWTVPGKRPDGTDHKFKDIAIGRLPRSGYLGFQNLLGDCWFKNIRLKTHARSSSRPDGGAIVGSP